MEDLNELWHAYKDLNLFPPERAGYMCIYGY